jgi:tryptophan halogenase
MNLSRHSSMKIQSIIVLGGGSAGFTAAITLKRTMPHLHVTMLRSPEIGIIGVGEGTTPFFPNHFHQFLKLPMKEFYERAQPTWKLGIRFLWGQREFFDYSFEQQFAKRTPGLPKNNGFYHEKSPADWCLGAGLMARNKAFASNQRGIPEITLHTTAYHIENIKLVDYLEWQAAELGIVVKEETVEQVDREGEEITALHLRSGGTVSADLYVDASGFASKLLGQTLHEDFHDFSDTLFCDSAIIGPRKREENEEIQPYTTAETMDHGWCWRIDHENHINRGYVYSSKFVSDEQAEAEFRQKNPAVQQTRLVRFRSGRYHRSWVGNVVAVGNAAGFVEPLEATALMLLCGQCRSLAEALIDSDGEPGPMLKHMFNRFMGERWDEIRDFLAIHYRFNNRLDTPFWQHCRENTPLHGAEEIYQFYRENGPSMLANAIFISPNDQFGAEGYLAMFLGMQVPYQKKHQPNENEQAILQQHKQMIAAKAAQGASVQEALQLIRDPRWRWT